MFNHHFSNPIWQLRLAASLGDHCNHGSAYGEGPVGRSESSAAAVTRRNSDTLRHLKEGTFHVFCWLCVADGEHLMWIDGTYDY